MLFYGISVWKCDEFDVFRLPSTSLPIALQMSCLWKTVVFLTSENNLNLNFNLHTYFWLPVASDFLQTSPFFSSASHSLFFYCCFCIFFRLSCFLLVLIEIYLFSVFIHAKQGRKRLSRHLFQNRPMIILSPALHMFTCMQLFLQCSAAAELWRLRVRVSVSICVQMTWLCLSAYVCSCL